MGWLNKTAYTLAFVGAINWGAQQMGTNLVTTLTTSLNMPGLVSPIYYIVAVGGIAAAADYFGVYKLN